MNWNIPTLEELEDAIWRCTACGTCKVTYEYGPPSRCREICPSGTEFGFEGFMAAKGKIAFARGILSGELEWDDDLAEAVYRCTLCAGCQTQCQLDHKPHIPDIFEALRRKAVEAGAGPLPQQRVIAQSLKSYDNPYQGPRRVRWDWTRPFKKEKRFIKDINKEPAPVLYFVGCTGAYNLPARVLPQATASVFQKLGVDFGILGENELCCGSTAMRLGDAEAFKRMAEANLQTFKNLHETRGVQTIVTACAGCYRAILKDYSLADEFEELMQGIRVIHVTQFLSELHQAGKLTFSQPVPMKVTYHDPCHAGRHLTKYLVDDDGSQLWPGAYIGLNEEDCLYDIPRDLLKAIPGIELVEMERTRANSFCCGGGGGVMTGFPDWAQRNAALRIQEGLETGAEHMVSICPFCHYNLNQGAQGIGSAMKLYDLIELIDRALPEKS